MEDDQKYFIALHGGGTVLAGGVKVLTTKSPLGQALVGKEAGDAIEFRGKTLEISSVS